MTDVAASLLAQAEAREERLKLAVEAVLAYAEAISKPPDAPLSTNAVGRDLIDLIRSQLAVSTPAG